MQPDMDVWFDSHCLLYSDFDSDSELSLRALARRLYVRALEDTNTTPLT